MCTVARPNLLADCQLSVVRPQKIGTNHPLQGVVVDYSNIPDYRMTVNPFMLLDIINDELGTNFQIEALEKAVHEYEQKRFYSYTVIIENE